MATTKRLTAVDLFALLETRYSGDEWVILSEVRNAAGYDATRTADAIAMNMWPSRGLALHGFEIKVSRSDWVRELKDPGKADAFMRRVDYWWLVVSDAAIVHDGGWTAPAGIVEALAIVIEGRVERHRRSLEIAAEQLDRISASIRAVLPSE